MAEFLDSNKSTGTEEELKSNVDVLLTGVTNVVSAVTHEIEDIVISASSGASDMLHNVSSEVQRFIYAPPIEGNVDELDENFCSESYLVATPNSDKNINKSLLTMDSSSKESTCSNMEDKNLGLAENYFSKPEFYDIAITGGTIEEIENAITECKSYIMNTEEGSSDRRNLVHQLIQLRLILERTKEEEEVRSLGIQVIQGHQLAPLLSPLRQPTKQFCDKCTRVIWNVIHVMYKCKSCGYQCHGKCVKNKHRKCPQLKFELNPTCQLDICPQIGLAEQNFRCAECHYLITNKNVWAEPRLCDYTGRFYCPVCHWNGRTMSPARIIHNWDFEEQIMSREAIQYLKFIYNKPIFCLDKLNQNLFKFVDDLNNVKKIREDIILMKVYLKTCKMAQEEQLLKKLKERQHFVESADFYSLKDLSEVNDGTLVQFLENVHQQFVSHIKDDCEVCKGKGFICELCSNENVIFPFDNRVTICEQCSATFHQLCFTRSANGCPRCLRLSKRKTSHDDISSTDLENCS